MNKRKILLSIIICLFSLQYGFAQLFHVNNLENYDNKNYHFGFILGLNKMYFSIEPTSDISDKIYSGTQIQDLTSDSARIYSIESNPTTGFTIGIVSNLRLGKYFDLRFIPSLAFGEREIQYSILGYRNDESEIIDIRKKVTSTFVEFPLELKYKSKRYNNTRAYVLSGMKYTIDLASQANKKEENNQIEVKLLKNDFSFELGVGFDFYTTFFKFGTELKMSYGLNNMVKYEDNIYSGGIANLKSKVFLLSFTFE